MKKQGASLFAVFCVVLSLIGSDTKAFATTLESTEVVWSGQTHADTVPKVEIMGRLKVSDMPEGSGTQVVTDGNGNLFRSMMMPPTGGRDSLTYTIITGFGPVFPPGTYPLQAFNVNGVHENFTGSGVAANLTKGRDEVSPGFVYLIALQPANSIEIEVKVYESGASTRYFSYKLKNITVLAFSHGTEKGEEGLSETYTLVGTVFGVKNVETGGSFAFDSVTDMEVSY